MITKITYSCLMRMLFIILQCSGAVILFAEENIQERSEQNVANGKKASSDSISISGVKIAVADLTPEDLTSIPYQDLVNLPFETLIALSNQLKISIDEILKVKVVVSSKAASSIREQPNIMTIITEDQIKKSGLPDLLSLLRTVPGIFFGTDVSGVIGIGMRGIWGQEGKILLLVDGLEMNELRYSGIPFFNHFDLEQIKRIEILRGSGSSVWGGSAEMGAINIITKRGADINGLSVTASGSYLSDVFGRANLSVAFGKKIKDFETNLNFFWGNAHKSNQTYKSFYFLDRDPANGLLTCDLSGEYGKTETKNIRADFSWRNFSATVMYDMYKQYAMDLEIYNNDFETAIADLKYDFSLLSNKLKFTPRYNFKLSKPWITEGYGGNETIIRNTAGVSASFEPDKRFTLVSGLETFIDKAALVYRDSTNYNFYNGKNTITYDNYVVYSEALLKLGNTRLTVGGRLQYNNEYGSAFAPRIGFNQTLGNFHFKVLFSKAFRSPGIGNLETSPDIDPEKTYVFELETGYKLNQNMFLTANIFNVLIRKPIFYLEEGDYWEYRNGNRLGSSGFEMEYTVRHEKITGFVNYSHYIVNTKSALDLERYRSNLSSQTYLGAPKHKVSLLGIYTVNKIISLSSAVNIYGPSYAYLSTSIEPVVSDNVETSESIPQEQKLQSAALVNIGVTFSTPFTKKLSIQVGISDLLDSKYPFVQPYNGFEAPIPGQGRSMYCKAKYLINFKKPEDISTKGH